VDLNPIKLSSLSNLIVEYSSIQRKISNRPIPNRMLCMCVHYVIRRTGSVMVMMMVVEITAMLVVLILGLLPQRSYDQRILSSIRFTWDVKNNLVSNEGRGDRENWSDYMDHR